MTMHLTGTSAPAQQPPAEQPLLKALWTLVEIALLLLAFLGLQRLFEVVWEGCLVPLLTSRLV